MSGMPDQAAVFYDGGPVFETLEGFNGTVLARYAETGHAARVRLSARRHLSARQGRRARRAARRRPRRPARLPPAMARPAVRDVQGHLQRGGVREVGPRGHRRSERGRADGVAEFAASAETALEAVASIRADFVLRSSPSSLGSRRTSRRTSPSAGSVATSLLMRRRIESRVDRSARNDGARRFGVRRPQAGRMRRDVCRGSNSRLVTRTATSSLLASRSGKCRRARRPGAG